MTLTASIEVEIETIADYIRPLFETVWHQYLPKQYKPKTCSVRYMPSEQFSASPGHSRIERSYQLVIFGVNELEVIRQIDQLQQSVTNIEALQLKGSSRYMRIGSFLSSEPFLTEDKEVYAAICVLHAEVRIAKKPVESPTIGGIIIRPVYPTDPEDGNGNGNGGGTGGNGGDDGNGGIIINPDYSDEIIVGKDCRPIPTHLYVPDAIADEDII